MLDLIIQGQEEKVTIDTYRVSNQKGANRIYGYLYGDAQGELASYKEVEDATRVFWAMVVAESRGLFVQLPDDDPRKIASFSALVKTTSGDCFGDKIG